tara:strand:- start:775 stop:1071 length:297 start_codon:yes stop_codon:yes gene_type:complete
MSVIKINKLAKLIEIFDEMSKDLYFGRLSNFEKDVLLNLSKQYSIDKNPEINIRQITFTDFEGKTIAKSTLYKVLKTLCEKNLISHLGSERSSVYKLN